MTIGYILLGPDLSLEDVSDAIKSQFPLFSHPLFVPTLLAELTAFNLMSKLTDLHAALATIENDTGFSDWRHSDHGDLANDVVKHAAKTPAKDAAKPTTKDAMKAAANEAPSPDYRKLARNLGALNSRFAFIEVAIRCTLMATDFTKQEIRALKDYVPTGNALPPEDVANNLSERIDFLASNLKHMQVFGGITQRINAQQNVVSCMPPLPSLRLQ